MIHRGWYISADYESCWIYWRIVSRKITISKVVIFDLLFDHFLIYSARNRRIFTIVNSSGYHSFSVVSAMLTKEASRYQKHGFFVPQNNGAKELI